MLIYQQFNEDELLLLFQLLEGNQAPIESIDRFYVFDKVGEKENKSYRTNDRKPWIQNSLEYFVQTKS